MGTDQTLSSAPVADQVVIERRHIPALDGVRGLAIACVIVRHLALELPSLSQPGALLDRILGSVGRFGYLGVDLFFVLSGFLITGILVDAKGGTRYFRTFYARRVLRIFPLYYAACLFFIVILPHVPNMANDPGVHTLVRNQAWYWLYATNLLAAFNVPEATPLQTAHFWSLAVEEQFYLIWPFIIWICSRRALWRVTIGAIVVALLIRIALVLTVPDGWGGAYILMPARIDALGVGALLALTVREPGGLVRIARMQRIILPIAAVGILGLSAVRHGFEYHDSVVVTLGFSIVALGGGALIGCALVAPGMSATGRFFRSPILRSLGRYSYALYVVHYPMFYVVHRFNFFTRIPPVMGSTIPAWSVMSLVLIGLSFAVAWVSWHVYEAPILRLKRFVPEPVGKANS
jgi:peptidoglycan/LPS O-acetylase OafA/YrhL